MEIILAMDPGESTGYAVRDDQGKWSGGTIKHNREAVWEMLQKVNPDVLIFETFRLYASHAKSLVNNTFYTCEIIGILKLYADIATRVKTLRIVEYPAQNKPYSGAKTSDENYLELKANGENVTEHTFDAYMHLCFFLRHDKKR